MNDDNSEERKESRKALRMLGFGMLLGFGFIVIFGFHGESVREFFTISSMGFMAAGASLLVGGMLGFLFGIPKTLQQEFPTGKSDEKKSDQKKGKDEPVKYRVNTNLEQISDWLTKMLVGVGLTQLYALPDRIQKLTEYIGAGLGDSSYNEAFALALLLYFLVVGFLFGYLWTRLFFTAALREADMIVVLQDKLEKTDKEVEQFKEQHERDKDALKLTFKQLNRGLDELEIAQDALNSAISSASEFTRVQIYSQAAQMRAETWRDPLTKWKMERTIPIFKALINSDPEEKYHKNYGQLGFALKDKRESDWAEAESKLTKAINIRNSKREPGWLIYEFCRAFCRIKQDKAFEQDKPSEPETKKDILDDLSAASKVDFMLQKTLSDPVIQKWMKLNGVNMGDLTSSGKQP